MTPRNEGHGSADADAPQPRMRTAATRAVILLSFFMSSWIWVAPDSEPGSVTLPAKKANSPLEQPKPLFGPPAPAEASPLGSILGRIRGYRTGLTEGEERRLAEAIALEAARSKHDYRLILAIIEIESSFDNWAVSSKGAKGLMQIKPVTGEAMAVERNIRWEGDRTLFNPVANIRLGVHYLDKLVSRFPDLDLALTAYNQGPTYIDSLLDAGAPIPRGYSDRVLRRYARLQR